MCGRFSLRLPREEIRQVSGHDDLDVDDWIDEDHFVPRYNIAPRSQAPVLRRRDPGPSDSNDVHYILQSMKWGLVPHWSKFEDKTLSTTNARSENLIEGGGMWASIKGKKRCAVLCQGYYEWLNRGKEKLPYFTKHKNGEIMFMAGLYDRVTLEGQATPLWTFTIVTTAANKDFEWLHDRQPVILSTRKALDAWLDTSSQSWTPELSKIVEPYNDSASPLECYQVPKEVGKVGAESSTFIEPVSKRKDGIQAMFSKQKESQESKPIKEPKMKRSRSSSPSHVHDLTAGTSQVPKRSKIEKLEDDEVSIVATQNIATQKPKSEHSKKKQSPKKHRSMDPVAPSTKITSFFNKAQ